MESADAEGWMAGGGELPETALSNAFGGRADVHVEVLPMWAQSSWIASTWCWYVDRYVVQTDIPGHYCIRLAGFAIVQWFELLLHCKCWSEESWPVTFLPPISGQLAPVDHSYQSYQQTLDLFHLAHVLSWPLAKRAGSNLSCVSRPCLLPSLGMDGLSL